MTNTTKTSGYTLLELLAYFSVFAVAVNLAGALFTSATRLQMLGDEAMDRMQALDEIAVAFSETVRESEGLVDKAGPYATGDGVIALALPKGRLAVMGRLRGDSRFVLLKLHKDELAKPEYMRTFPHPIQELHFERSNASAAIEMQLRLGESSSRDSAEHVVIAAPRSLAGGAP